jgi:serine/threonine protein kinase
MMVDGTLLQANLPAGVDLGCLIYDGGQRAVFEADDNGRRVVVKVMPVVAQPRAEREVSIGSTFDHPNLARILDDEVSGAELDGQGFVWFREEFIEGETLAERAQRYEPCKALALVADLIAAVSYLWEQHDVVHRDIKPLNIMCRPDGSHVLLDVGIGRHQRDESITTGPLGPGTAGYIAPEQLLAHKGRLLDARTDLFLIGIVLFEVLTGVRPFDANDPDYYLKLQAGDWPRPEGLPDAVAGLLERFLGSHPHQRPSHTQAAELVYAAREELGCS